VAKTIERFRIRGREMIAPVLLILMGAAAAIYSILR
jgi:hypothetical protein